MIELIYDKIFAYPIESVEGIKGNENDRIRGRAIIDPGLDRDFLAEMDRYLPGAGFFQDIPMTRLTSSIVRAAAFSARNWLSSSPYPSSSYRA